MQFRLFNGKKTVFDSMKESQYKGREIKRLHEIGLLKLTSIEKNSIIRSILFTSNYSFAF